ncbi:hypothetical protein N7468_000716 [Penicillium chermesinum]|uniref:FMN-dependent dehydrogenase domain-containing protein n=1 Tax=Penicillium chermesinum TaxID=63820 RepID=A0A9W9PMP2_9EURO|nr:uncharacterized protein N7468_000716 [Penicillium chermesinum]KAJ5249265.1 hypothetical protein N7468_000716 [Penicillium chermesinum]
MANERRFPGRRLDGAVGSLDVLPEIVHAVGSDMIVLFNSGIRRTGSDTVKALALGAHAVLSGKTTHVRICHQWQISESCVAVLADLYLSMATAGIPSISACSREVLRKIPSPRDVKL